MKRILKWVCCLLLLVVALGLHSWYFRPILPSWFYNRVMLSFLLQDPETVTSIGILPTWLGRFDRLLTDSSPAREAEQAKWAAETLETLQGYDREGMDEEGKISYDSMAFFLQAAIDSYRFRDDYPVNQMFGVQASLPNFMMQQHPVTNRSEAEDYVARLRLFPWKFDGVLAGLKERAGRGVMPPHFTIVEVLAQMRGFVAKPAAENPLYVSFAGKLAKLPPRILGEEQKKALLAATSAAIANDVYPAYGKLIAFFAEAERKFPKNYGAWSLPNGDDYYAWCVRTQTTSDLTPEQAHLLGLSEVIRVAGEMDAALRKIGRISGSVGDRMKALSSDPGQFYSDDDAGRQAILKDYTAILAEADKASAIMFNRRPKMAITVRSVPEFAQATAPGAYYEPGDMSGKRGGVFYFNQRDLKETPKWLMRSLAYHEGIPGHHFQISIAQEQNQLPVFRQMFSSFLFTAYTEGWALYAEKLGGEMGLEDDPLDALGRLSYEMLRSVRLVVDTGIHAKHWTREQAISFTEEHTGMGHGQVVAEVERYFVNPGQALAYKVGELRILALRSKAQQAQGGKFDIKAFHDQVLIHGGLALSSLDMVIADWLGAR